MPQDNRNSQRVTSDVTTVPSGDATTQTVVELTDDQTLAVGYLKVEYAGSATNESTVELFDEYSSTTSGNLTDKIEKFVLQPGDRIVIEEPFLSEIENDFVAAADGNSDGEITVTVGGPLLTG